MTLHCPPLLKGIQAYQLYLQGKTVESIALQLKVPLSSVLGWKKDDQWDDRVRDHEIMLLSTIDGEAKTWAKAAMNTAGVQCCNSFVLAARELQRRLETPGKLTMKELTAATKSVLDLALGIKALSETGMRTGGFQNRTKEKHLSSSPASLPPVPTMVEPQNDSGDGEAEEGVPGGFVPDEVGHEGEGQ